MMYHDEDNDIEFEQYEGGHNAEEIYTFIKENKDSGLETLDFMNFEVAENSRFVQNVLEPQL